jgi:hypothetical protein
MMQKRTLYSLLLTSFILVFALTSAQAQTVTFGSPTVLRCEQGYLDITIDPGQEIGAFEIIFKVESTADLAFFTNLDVDWDGGFTVLTNRIVDLSGVDYVTPDTVRIAGMLDDGDACMAAEATTIAQLAFTTNDVCSGNITISEATYSYEYCPGHVLETQTQFVDCAGTEVIPAAVTAGVVTIVNVPPTLDPIADTTIHWGDVYQNQMVADDDDLDNGCEALSYYKVGTEPAGLTVDPNTGAISWPTTGADVGNHVIEVQVEDVCGDTASTTFEICVENTPPTITCPEETTNIIWGYTATGGVVGFDPDGGPLALTYELVSFSGPGAVTVDPASGDWSWPTMEDNAYLGDFELCIRVHDGANLDDCSPLNADTCCLMIHVIPTLRVFIEKTHNSLQGHMEEVSIYFDDSIDPPNEIGGYDLLIDYDQTALSFVNAEAGQMLLDCGWEYFVYRHGPNGNCGPGPCPSGVVRMVALAETNNGANHPGCFDALGEMAKLTFLVTDDRTFECQYAPIKFVWYDCGDNGFSSVTGDTLFISRYVYTFDGMEISDPTAEFPTFYGANSDCDTALGDDKPDPIRAVDFTNGGVDIICADSIDARGDINLNELAYEVADAVVFTNYFVHGLSAFHVNVDGQIAATDVNADGITLSVADLVYLVRVIIGDASPYPKQVVSVEASYAHSNGILTVKDGIEMGAAYMVFEGDIMPELLAEDMQMKYNFDGENTRVLVYSLTGNTFTGDVVRAQAELVAVEMATAEGNPVVGELVPDQFALMQNYPNPFNPTTTISFQVKEDADFTLTIYNVNGQVVEQVTDHATVPEHTYTWNASNLASGVYLYKLQIGNYSATKKMVLLK